MVRDCRLVFVRNCRLVFVRNCRLVIVVPSAAAARGRDRERKWQADGVRADGVRADGVRAWLGCRRTAGLILCGLALAPRVTIFYLLFFARQPLFLVIGPGT